MAITTVNMTNPKAPATATPAIPDLKDQQKKLDKLKKDQKQVTDISKDIQDKVTKVNKSLEQTFGKSAKLICLLRLDMVADKLDGINHRLASQIDLIANTLENTDWDV
jgi:hypothetical protein